MNYIKKRASQQVMTQRNHLPLSSSFSEFNFRETEGDAFFLSKPPDKEEKFPVIQSNNQPSQSNNSKTLRMKSQTNIRGFNLEDGSIKKEETHLSIPLNYFYDDYRNSLHFYFHLTSYLYTEKQSCSNYHQLTQLMNQLQLQQLFVWYHFYTSEFV